MAVTRKAQLKEEIKEINAMEWEYVRTIEAVEKLRDKVEHVRDILRESQDVARENRDVCERILKELE